MNASPAGLMIRRQAWPLPYLWELIEPEVPRTAVAMLGYDDLYAIDYMGDWLRSYWKTKESAKTFSLVLAETPSRPRNV